MAGGILLDAPAARSVSNSMQEALTHLKSADPVLARIIDETGPYVIEFQEPDYEALAKSIIYQQLSGKVAAVIFNRVAAAAGGGKLTAEGLLRLRMQKLRAAGLSRQKIEYLRGVARRTVSGALDFESLGALADSDVHQKLTEIKGIGVWTAQMFLIFALRRHNVMPSADLGIRVAIRKAYGLAETPKPAEVDELSKKWHPWRTIASWYLWRSLGDKAGM
jgi:DNA-3-methyladenine glycosylase II